MIIASDSRVHRNTYHANECQKLLSGNHLKLAPDSCRALISEYQNFECAVQRQTYKKLHSTVSNLKRTNFCCTWFTLWKVLYGSSHVVAGTWRTVLYPRVYGVVSSFSELPRDSRIKASAVHKMHPYCFLCIRKQYSIYEHVHNVLRVL